MILTRLCSLYEGTRSSTLLKVKVRNPPRPVYLLLTVMIQQTFYDAEARVDGYVPGKGKNVGVTGALKCVMASGKVCEIFRFAITSQVIDANVVYLEVQCGNWIIR